MKLCEYPLLLKVKDIKNILRIGQRQTYELVKTAEFKAMRLGEKNLFSKEKLIDWLEGREIIK